MSEDRWFAAWSKIQQRCANSTTEFDFGLLWPARVVEWEESGINPSGLVGVAFISEPAASKIGTKKGVPVLPPVVGQRYVPLVGSQVLVGWQDGDERYPYATGWLGLGGADTVAHAFETSYTFEGPLVDVFGAVKSQQELGRSGGVVTVTPNTPVVTPASLTFATDTAFVLNFTVAATQTLAAGVKIADVTLAQDFTDALMVVASPNQGGAWPPGAALLCSASFPKTLSIYYNAVAPIAGLQSGLSLTCFVRG